MNSQKNTGRAKTIADKWIKGREGQRVWKEVSEEAHIFPTESSKEYPCFILSGHSSDTVVTGWRGVVTALEHRCNDSPHSSLVLRSHTPFFHHLLLGLVVLSSLPQLFRRHHHLGLVWGATLFLLGIDSLKCKSRYYHHDLSPMHLRPCTPHGGFFSRHAIDLESLARAGMQATPGGMPSSS